MNRWRRKGRRGIPVEGGGGCEGKLKMRRRRRRREIKKRSEGGIREYNKKKGKGEGTLGCDTHPHLSLTAFVLSLFFS